MMWNDESETKSPCGPQRARLVLPPRAEVLHQPGRSGAFGKHAGFDHGPRPLRGPDGSYFIRSLYFDDVASSALRQKLDGVDERKKFRIRTYNLKDDQISLECKEKKGQFIHKSAVRISRALCEQILSATPGGCLRWTRRWPG